MTTQSTPLEAMSKSSTAIRAGPVAAICDRQLCSGRNCAIPYGSYLLSIGGWKAALNQFTIRLAARLSRP